MKRLVCVCALVLLFAVPAFSGGFDTLNPPYGEKLTDMKYKEHFVKYAEKNGVAYYNYIGPRIPNPMYEVSNPRLSYGFVDGKLYSCIFQNWDVPKKKIVDMINSAYGQVPKKAYDEGDWSIYVWYFPKKNVDFKLKFNNMTMEVKSSFYYLPLKKLLKK